MLFTYLTRPFSETELILESTPLCIGKSWHYWARSLRIKTSLFILLALIIVTRYAAAAEPPFKLPPPLEIRKLRSAIIQTTHIILSDSPHMDQNYTVFGQLIGGWRTLDQLRAGDIIDTVRVFVVND